MMTELGWQALCLVAIVLAFIRSKPRPRTDTVDVAPLVLRLERLEREQSIDIAARETAAHEKSAELAVVSAEQLYKANPKSGQDKARAAVGFLMSAHPALTATAARMLVEAAVARRGH